MPHQAQKPLKCPACTSTSCAYVWLPPPVDGKANNALLTWAAKTFGVAKKQVELLHGATSRQKVIQIDFSSETQLQDARVKLQNLQQIPSNSKEPT